MRKLKYLFAILLPVLLGTLATAQIITPPVITTDWDVHDLASTEDTLIVGGRFAHVGKFAGGMALFTTTSDQPSPGFPKLATSDVVSSTTDGNGGFYILNGDGYILHILNNHTIDPSFSIQGTGGGVLYAYSHILFYNGTVYLGSQHLDLVFGPNVGDLVAFDVGTQQRVLNLPIVNGAIKNIRAKNNLLYIMGSFMQVGTSNRNGIAVVDMNTNTLTPWYPQLSICYAVWQTFNDVAFYGNQVIVAGSFGDTCGPGNTLFVWHDVVVDGTSGVVNRFLQPEAGLFAGSLNQIYWAANAEKIAVEGNTLYVYTLGTFDTRLTAINLANNDAVLWARFFNMTAGATDITTAGNAVFVTGYYMEEIYALDSGNYNVTNVVLNPYNAVKLDGATGAILNWHPNPVALIDYPVKTLTINGNEVFMGGFFSHVNGMDRHGIYAMTSSTQEILPFQINADMYEPTNSIKLLGNTVFLAGDWTIPNQRSVRTFNLNTGQEMPLSNRYFGEGLAVEANNNYVFLGGDITDTTGGVSKAKLIAIDRATGHVVNWTPNPNGLVKSLHIANGKLYVGGEFTQISGQNASYLAVYDAVSLSQVSFPVVLDDNVTSIKSDDSLLYIGGAFTTVNNTPVRSIAAISKLNGSLSRYCADIQNHQRTDVTDILARNKTIFSSNRSTGGFFGQDSCGSPYVYKGDTVLLKANDVCIDIDSGYGNLYALELVGNSLYYAGNFMATNNQLLGTNIGRLDFPAGYFNSLTSVAGTAGTATSVKIYPSPASDEIILETDGNELQNTAAYVLDMQGRMLTKATIKSRQQHIKIDTLTPGFYMLKTNKSCYNFIKI